MSNKPLTLALAALLSLAGLAAAPPARADGPKWTDNFTAATAEAQKDHKMLLLDFTGSDWCPYCIRLDKDVFGSDAFARWADKFVLVKVDFPQSKQLPPQVEAQNQQLQHKFNIDGFPTIIILNSDQKELTRSVGYDGASPQQWIQARDAAIAQATSK